MITTQVIDTSRGVPASQISVELDVFITGHGWREVGRGVTDDEGRIRTFGEPNAAGLYRLMFDVATFIPDCFFPSIAATFPVDDPQQVYHVPLLVSRFGYTTYRGN